MRSGFRWNISRRSSLCFDADMSYWCESIKTVMRHAECYRDDVITADVCVTPKTARITKTLLYDTFFTATKIPVFGTTRWRALSLIHVPVCPCVVRIIECVNSKIVIFQKKKSTTKMRDECKLKTNKIRFRADFDLFLRRDIEKNIQSFLTFALVLNRDGQ